MNHYKTVQVKNFQGFLQNLEVLTEVSCLQVSTQTHRFSHFLRNLWKPWIPAWLFCRWQNSDVLSRMYVSLRACQIVSLHLIIRVLWGYVNQFVPLWELSHASLTSRGLLAKTQRLQLDWTDSPYFLRHSQIIWKCLWVFLWISKILRYPRKSVGNVYNMIPNIHLFPCGFIWIHSAST